MSKVLFAVSLLAVLTQVSQSEAAEYDNWNDFKNAVGRGYGNPTVSADIDANSELNARAYADMVISGSNASNNFTINGENNHLFIGTSLEKSLTIRNLNFENFKRFNPTLPGNQNRHAIFSADKNGYILFENVRVNNVAQKDDDDAEPIWGAVFNVSDGGSATIKNSKFTNNVSSTVASGADNAIGGVIQVQGKQGSYSASKLNELSGSIFDNNSMTATNTSAHGGVLYLEGKAENVKDNTFANNTVTGINAYGGAISVGGANSNRGTAKLTNLTGGSFTANKVVANSSGGKALGGAIYVSQYGEIDNISDVTFNGNSADEGGAIYNAGLIDKISSSKFKTSSDTIVNVKNINTISDSTIVGELSNRGTITTISGGSTGVLNNYGEIASITNSATGNLTNSATITTISGGSTGVLNNYGEIASITNSATGNLTNSATITTIFGGSITNLTNGSTIGLIENAALTGKFQNSGTADVKGTFGSASATTENSGKLTFEDVVYNGVLKNDNQLEFKGGANKLFNGLFTNNGVTTAVGTLEANAVNNGTMSFDGVDYVGNLENNIRLNTSGNTKVSGTLKNTNQMNVSNGALSISGGLQNSGIVMNNGVLTISGNSANSGFISGDITVGDGATASVFANSGYVMGKTNIADKAVVKSTLEELQDIDIAAGGRLDIDEDSILKHNITGAGETRIANKLYLGQGSLSANGVVTVTNNGMIDLEDKTINVGTFNLNGVLDVDISSISANLADYTGGKVVVSNGATIDNSAKLTVTIASDMLEKGEKTGELKLIDGANISGKFNNIASNNRYKIEAGATDGTIVVTGIASAGDVAGTVGNINNQNTAIGWDAANVASGSKAAEIKAVLNEASQHDAARYVRDLGLIAPTDANLALMTTRELNNQISRSTWNRFGRNQKYCNEPFAKSAMWMEGLGNYSHQDNQFEAAGFSARTAGYMLGVDATVDCATTAGVGYAFNYTDASSNGRDTHIKGHTVFTYAKYQPEYAYVRGVLSYGYADYKEKSAVEGISLSSKYNVQALSGEAATGYEFRNGFIPETGLRYTYLMPESYTDSLGQKINPDNSDLLTATAMLHFRPRCGDVWYNVRPTAYVGLTYDLYGPNSKTNVRIADSGYQINSKRMPRLGAEGGIGLETSINNWDISIGYDLGLREDYQSHTGMLRARYNF